MTLLSMFKTFETIKDGLGIARRILETSSKFSGPIKVVQRGAETQLIVGGLVQSINYGMPGIARRVWGEMVARVENSGLEIKDCLILGLGGGTVASLLSNYFPDAKIDGVDIDPVILDIGRKYFRMDQIPNLNIIHADAFEIVDEKPSSISGKIYDFILVDLYQGEHFPERAASEEFMRALSKKLNPKGLVMFNRTFIRRYQDEVKKFRLVVERFFDEVETHIVPGTTGSDNVLVYGRNKN